MATNGKNKNLCILKGRKLDKIVDFKGFIKGYLSKIERSYKTPHYATAQKIAGALQIDLAEKADYHIDDSLSKNIDSIVKPDYIKTSEQITLVYEKLSKPNWKY